MGATAARADVPAGAAPAGLDEQEAARRLVERRRTEERRERTSRSVPEILRANVLTRFNAILGALLVVILIVGPPQDALFGVVLVANTAIGVVQELRAKRSLDRLAVIVAPTARVVRGGRLREIPADEVVVGDVLRVGAGDQLVVDGLVLDGGGAEVDESLLTGEADPVAKAEGDEVLSGSFVVAGSTTIRATRVGAEAYARRLSTEARAFSLVRSELRVGIDRILRLVTWLLLPTSILLVASQLRAHASLHEALRGSVAGIGSMIPEGLVLLTSIAFAAAVVRLSGRRVLVQELAAVEVLARVDVVCLDKTGTLTEPRSEVRAVRPAAGVDSGTVDRALATLARIDDDPNPTMQAISDATAAATPFEDVTATTPFSSARKWSAFQRAGGDTWVVGAPEIVSGGSGAVARDAASIAAGRVLLLAHADAALVDGGLPEGLHPAATVVLEETIRPDAPAMIEYFAREGVTVKVISGDHPATVATVAQRCGVDPGVPIDARSFDAADATSLEDAVEVGTVFGRVTPHQKREMVDALRRRGHVVAMTGDGVNDVLALKAADLGVAMASGSAAARAVAPVVLLTSSFASLPSVVEEGRRVIGNVERVASLFLTKTAYAFLLAVAVGVARLPFPFLPRHLTIVSSLTIGVPAFFLALSPNRARSRPGFVARSLRFAIPAGAVAAAGTFATYALVRAEPGASLIESRSAATLTLFGIGVWVLTILARPWTTGRQVLVSAMVAAFVLLASIPSLRRFFELDLPRPVVTFGAIGVVAAANVALELGWQAAHAVERFVLRHRTGS